MAGLKGYELIEEIPGTLARSFRAKSLAGRAVTVHVLPGPWAPEHEGIKARLRALSLDALAQLVDVGEQGGYAYVVTSAPPFLALMAWIQHHEAPQPKDPDRFSRAGAWKVPASLAPPGPSEATRTMQVPLGLGPQAAPPPTMTGQGEFTKMFEAKQEAAPLPPMPQTEPANKPDEFTKIFPSSQEGGTPPRPMPTAAMPAAPVPEAMPAVPTAAMPAAAPPAAGPSREPGEFTKMFRAQPAPEPVPPAVPPAAIPAPAPPPMPRAATPATPPASTGPSNQPGEFTKMFLAMEEAATEAQPLTAASPAPPQPLAVAPPQQPPTPPAAPQPASEPGEFTKMFRALEDVGSVPQASTAAPPDPPEPLAVTPPQPPTPPAVPKPASEPGEFTRIFQAQEEAAAAPVQPPEPPKPASAPGAFTRLFHPPPEAFPDPSPDAETTLIMQPPAPPAPPAPPTPVKAVSPPGEFTRLFHVPSQPTAGEEPQVWASTPPPDLPPPARTEAPGAFNQLFEPQRAPKPKPMQAPSPRPEADAGPGEFTRMFEAPQSTPLPGQGRPAPPPKPQKPEPFLDMFAPQSPVVEPQPEVRHDDDFTRFFNKPNEPARPGQPAVRSTAGPPKPEPGGFTQMISQGSYRADAPPASHLPESPGSGATGVFSSSEPTGPAEPQGPSEFTRMISRPDSSGAPGPAAHGAAGGAAKGGSMPKMPHMPHMPHVPQPPRLPQVVPGMRTPQLPRVQQPHMPHMPHMPSGAAAIGAALGAPIKAAKAAGTNTLLIAICCVAAFLLGIVVMLFVMKK